MGFIARRCMGSKVAVGALKTPASLQIATANVQWPSGRPNTHFGLRTITKDVCVTISVALTVCQHSLMT